MRTAGLFLVTGLLASGAASGQEDPASQNLRDSLAVRAVAEGIIAADNRGDLDAVLGFYASDALLLPPGEAPVRGKEAIRPRYVALFRGFDPEITGTIHEIVVRGDLAYVRGHNGGVLRGREGPDRSLNDVYLMVLRRLPEEGWRITRLIWHGAGP